MKKIIRLSIVLLFCLLFSNISYADYGVPEIIEYDATVINEDGTEIVDYSEQNEGLIPYGATVHVLYESDGYAFIEYNNITVNVRLEDIKPVSDDVDMSEADWGHKNMYVYREGAYLYKGPSITYGKLEENIEIPAGTVVEILASTEMWGYVEYDGYNGWVYIFTSDEISPYNMTCSLTNIAYKETSHYYTTSQIELTATPESETVTGTIPAGVTVDSYLTSNYPNPHAECVYVVYRDQKGWYRIDELTAYQDSSNQDISVFTATSCDIYQDRACTQKVETIPALTECKVIYETLDEYETQLCVEYNGTTGWLITSTYNPDGYPYTNEVPDIYKETIIPNKAINIIDFETMENTGDTIEAGKEYYQKYAYYKDGESLMYLEEIDNKESGGWVIDNTGEYSSINNNRGQEYEFYLSNYVDLSGVLDVRSDENTSDTDKSNRDEKSGEKRSIDKVLEDNLVLCIGIAVVVFVVAIILIIIINKKKKSKNNNSEKSEEVKEDEDKKEE